MGATQCNQFCNNTDKNQIVHIEVVPGSDISEWAKQEQKTGITQAFKVSRENFNEISNSSNSKQKELNQSRVGEKQSEQDLDNSSLPVVQVLKQQNRYIVPHNLVVSRVSEKTQLLMRKQFPTSPLAEDDARWYLLDSGNYYNGELIDEKPFGIGTYLLSDKVFYGETNINKPHGMGVIISDQYIFKGEFTDGKAAKDGTIESQSYNARGQFVDGQMTNGKVITRDYTYEGNFKNNKPEGKGFYHHINNKITYDGQFMNGKFHGIGKYVCQKYSYKGSFKDGLRDGKGTLEHFISDKIQIGVWEKDRFIMNL